VTGPTAPEAAAGLGPDVARLCCFYCDPRLPTVIFPWLVEPARAEPKL
jgi:hypothetical protein